jgi:hypothetical protein
MVSVTLTWDLCIVIFFAIVMSYSFIIGQHQSMRVIIASYIAIMATQGIGNVLARLMGDAQTTLHTVGIPMDVTVIAVSKIALFAICVIIFVVRSGITVTVERETGNILSAIYTGLFGFATAGLIASTLLTYAAGGGILDSGIVASSLIATVARGSTLMQLIILNQDIWFTLPAFLIIVTGLLHSE